MVRPGRDDPNPRRKAVPRVSGAFSSEEDLLNVNFPVGDRMLRLSDIAHVRRGYADPPQPMFRVNGEPAIGLAIAMREGGDILALGENIRRLMAAIYADLPDRNRAVTSSPIRPSRSKTPSRDFMTSLWQSVAIILAVSFISLGVRPGLVIALSIPLTLAIVFSVMELAGIDMQRISLGALIIALALLVDDAMTTTDATLNRLAAGRRKDEGRDVRLRTLRVLDARRHARYHRRFRPVGLRRAPPENTRSLSSRSSASHSLSRGSSRSCSRRCSASRF